VRLIVGVKATLCRTSVNVFVREFVLCAVLWKRLRFDQLNEVNYAN